MKSYELSALESQVDKGDDNFEMPPRPITRSTSQLPIEDASDKEEAPPLNHEVEPFVPQSQLDLEASTEQDEGQGEQAPRCQASSEPIQVISELESSTSLIQLVVSTS